MKLKRMDKNRNRNKNNKTHKYKKLTHIQKHYNRNVDSYASKMKD